VAEIQAECLPLDDVLKHADVITVHCPLTPDTRHLISKREFSLMKRGAFLINTARGPIVDEKALVEVLKSGGLRGAGLDVYEREPACEEELLGMDGVVLLPHIGSATVETRSLMAAIAVDNCIAGVTGGTPKNLVTE
jgi:glyoxylate reductase